MTSSEYDSSDTPKGNSAQISRPVKQKPKPAESFGEIVRQWPKITFCIVANEFCERFSFYGMRTVLTLYLLNILKFKKNDSSVFFNTFTALCYFSPILGSILADGFIGKFRTIFFVSIFYSAGQVLLAWCSTNDAQWSMHPWIDFLGLLIIALGTGGIKPCVSPFGGDQFDKHQTKMISLFFSVFYFSINAGSMISTFISPIFRATPCLGQDSCYPLAFGVPAALMIVATLVFMAGSFWYKKPPVKSNVLADVTVTIGKALVGKAKSHEKKEHWLDHALYNHNCSTSDPCLRLKKKHDDPKACAKQAFVDDVKTLVRVSVMFLPLPVFWSLYDQQGSGWVIQSLQMDCRLWGETLLLPDQMLTLNAVLILIFIPLFQTIIYPLVGYCFKVTPLRKMSAGGLVAALAFVISAFVQIEINKTLPNLPSSGNVYVSVFNNLDCDINVHANNQSFLVTKNSALTNTEAVNMFNLEANPSQEFFFSYDGCPADVTAVLPSEAQFNTTISNVGYIHVSSNGLFYAHADTDKPTDGTGEHAMSVIIATDKIGKDKRNLAFCRVTDDLDPAHPCDPQAPADFYWYQQHYNDENKTSDLHGNDDPFEVIEYASKNAKGRSPIVFVSKPVKPGKWRLYYMNETPKNIGQRTPPKEDIHVTPAGYEYNRTTQGAVLILSLTGDEKSPKANVFQVVPDNSVNILWQIPQIATITAAEIMFSITGLEFSYTEAAVSMKSVVGALFLLTTGVGDMLIVVITKLSPSDDMAIQFFFYAALMTAVIGIFILLSIFYYDYANFDKTEGLLDDDDEDDENESRSETRPITYDSRPNYNGTIPADRLAKSLEEDDAWQVRL